MNEIHISASKEYDYIISAGCLGDCGKLVRSLNGGSLALLVTDETVNSLYGETVSLSLQNSGYRVNTFLITPGENSKSISNWSLILKTLAEAGFSRSDVVVALGGGVVSDLAGFAAASFMRGISWVAIPTTMTAMTDASIGGKTAVNIPSGKNLAGSFWHPSLVICDPDLLKSLSEADFSNGISEVIKYGMIADEELLEMLSGPVHLQIEEIIRRCVSVKNAIVGADELDNGQRRLLNFGHTVGHAIEKCSGYSVSHGEAVSAGMSLMTKAAERGGYCCEGIYWELHTLLLKYGLPDILPYSVDELFRNVFYDKKRRGDTIDIVLPVKRGQCRVFPMSMNDLYSLLEAGASLCL